jgi:hypothetical protein
MNVAMDEHRRSPVVSALAAIGTFDGVVDRRCRTWSFQLLPQLRHEVLHPMCEVGAGRQVDVVVERAPELRDDVAQHVVLRAMVQNHVVHRRPEPFKQKCVSGEVPADQACAALPRSEIEHGRFEAELASISGNPDLED